MKKKFLKRVFSVVLAGALAMGFMPISALADTALNIAETDLGNWENYVYVQAQDLPDLTDSSIAVEFDLGQADTYGAFAFQSNTAGWPKLSNMTPDFNGAINSDGYYILTENGTFTLELTEDDITNLTSGLVISGYNTVIKSLTVVSNEVNSDSEEDSDTETDTEPQELVETIIFEGSESGTGVVKSVFTSGNIDLDILTSDGYMYVEYSSDAQDSTIQLAISEWDTSTWLQIAATEVGTTDEGYFAKYSFDAIATAYGSTDLSDIDAFSVVSSNTITATKVSWFGPAPIDDGAITLYSGSTTVTGTQELITYLYTAHVGGDFDISDATYGSYFTMEYTGDEAKLILALASVSGTTEWVAVQPTTTVTLDNGRYLSTFSIADCISQFGTNFKRLDQIQIYSYGYGAEVTEPTITLKKFKFYFGDGEIIDPNGETRWTNKITSGIAFIGDSIVQNAYLRYGDWNTILNRTDCVNWGIGGQTTVHIEKRIDDLLLNNYSKIVIHCGINDMGNGVTESETIANYESMFNKIHTALPNAEVFVDSVLPTTTPFYYTPESQAAIVSLNNALVDLIADYDFVTFIDIYPEFVDTDGYCKADLVFDGLHPNEDGYAVMASIINPYLGDIIEIETDSDTEEETDTDLAIATGNWENDAVYDISGITTAVAGDTITIEFTVEDVTSSAQIKASACNPDWVELDNDYALSSDATSFTITLTEEQAATINESVQLFVQGSNLLVSGYTFTSAEVENEGEIIDGYYYEEGEIVQSKGVVKVDGDLYYVGMRGQIFKGTVYVTEEKANGLLSEGMYTFGDDGKIIQSESNIINGYYYENGELVKGAGLVLVDEEYYYIKANGKIFVGAVYVTEDKANGLLSAGTYVFGDDGKLVSSGAIINGYYYENGQIVKSAGVVEIDGDLYYIGMRGQVFTGTVYVTEAKANGLIEAGKYTFDENGLVA